MPREHTPAVTQGGTLKLEVRSSPTLQEKLELETDTYLSLNRDRLETNCIQIN